MAQAAQALRADTDVLPLPQGLLPETFTLSELQDAAGCVDPVVGVMKIEPFRPAQVYRLRELVQRAC